MYLILDEPSFENGSVKIDAYFTLSHKALIPADVSKSKIKDAAGFKDAESIPFVLIGQLGKYIDHHPDDGLQKSNVSGATILEYAFEVIRESSELIPCRCVLVECNADKKIHHFYESNGFSFFQRDGELYQFYKKTINDGTQYNNWVPIFLR